MKVQKLFGIRCRERTLESDSRCPVWDYWSVCKRNDAREPRGHNFLIRPIYHAPPPLLDIVTLESGTRDMKSLVGHWFANLYI